MFTPSLESKIKNLTGDPGVYLMKGDRGEILYVGKAKNLKNRVSQYFQESRDRVPRIELLVRKIIDFEVIITDTEAEALILECSLIKKHKPRYNVRLKDDKAYPYVRMDVNHPFPRLEYVHRAKKDGARYFGPYVNSYALRDLLSWARKEFQLRDCSDHEFANRSRPCVLFQIGQCSAPCVQVISGEDYGRAVEYVLQILDGKISDVLKRLKSEMNRASDQEEFEKAALIRDRVTHLQELSESQKVQDPEMSGDRDLIQFHRDQGSAVVVLMAMRQGRTVGVNQFAFPDVDSSIQDSEFIFEFLSQYYVPQREEANPAGLPDEVLIPDCGILKEDLLLIRKVLGQRIDFRVPKRGEAAATLEMLKKTAVHSLEHSIKAKQESEVELYDVQRKLKLNRFPRRIECYDISHFQGEGTVASRVVFIDGRPEKTLYRHYHIESVDGPDDFKSMYEVLSRRFSKEESGLAPDLVVIDGGRGQLKQAEKVFAEVGVLNVELVSLAKARTEKDTMERVFKPGQKNPIALKPGTGVYKIMTQVRDEAHRFAITFHRKVRDSSRF